MCHQVQKMSKFKVFQPLDQWIFPELIQFIFIWLGFQDLKWLLVTCLTYYISLYKDIYLKGSSLNLLLFLYLVYKIKLRQEKIVLLKPKECSDNIIQKVSHFLIYLRQSPIILKDTKTHTKNWVVPPEQKILIWWWLTNWISSKLYEI